MKVVAIVQARMGSVRFPGKVMRPINGVPMIEILLRRLCGAKRLDLVVVATSEDRKNADFAEYVRSRGYLVFEGSENDVLDRYYQAAVRFEADAIVRVTGDCPLIDSSIVDHVIETYLASGADYVSNTMVPTFPDGLDVSIFSFEALQVAHREATRAYDREHVVPYIRTCGKFRCENVLHTTDHSLERWTVDEPSDFEVVSAVFAHFHPRTDFGWFEVLDLKRTQPEVFAANRHLIRDGGSRIGTGQKLWMRAKKVIPGGNMLLSKRSEMFLPLQWPSYFSRAKGCTVWDMDGRELLDMTFAVGTNTLGYGHPEVDEAVMNTIQAGNMSSLNCPEEVYLAEKLIELHPWAEMARFARSGGEANAIAIRIARAASGRDKVAICGYHGWHDWYLAANLGDEKSLAGHLLPGLEPNGVPRNLRGTVFPFNYNNIEELKHLVRNHDIGVIKMEVSRNHGPENGFLANVRELATRNGIVLIFDECTSGFRQTFGGLHKQYGVDPDIAMFGKALGNGYAITAIIGRRAVMEAAQTTFISSTFWTERVGPAAGLKTLEVMERLQSWDCITKTGNAIASLWNNLGEKHHLPIRVFGLPALIKFAFSSADALFYKTLVTQEMLARGFLASNIVYVSTEHTQSVVEAYGEALDEVFALIRQCEDGRDVKQLLRGPVCHAEFKRLN